MNINIELEKISALMHRRTGYSVIHAVCTMRDDGYTNPINPGVTDFFKFNSDEWEWFLDLLNEACK